MTMLLCLGEGIWGFFTLWFYILAKFLKHRCFHFSLLPLVNLSFSLFFLLAFYLLCIIQKWNQVASFWGKDIRWKVFNHQRWERKTMLGWQLSLCMCRIGLKVNSGCGLKYTARGQGFITTFSGGENNKSLRMWTISASSKLNQTQLPHSPPKLIWKGDLLPLTFQ